MVGLGLRYARSDRAHSDFGHQLDRNTALGLDVLQVVDQLGKILDRIDVVMRRGRNQAHTRRRMAHRADALVHLVSGQLPTFAGLCTLRHLDLDIVGIDQIFGGHAEPAAGDLFDPAAHRIAIVHRAEALRLLAAFARVRTPAQPVHGDGQRRMRFVADRTEAHRARAEALDDLDRRFDLVDVDGLFGRLQFHQSADRQQPFGLLVDRCGELLVILRIVAAYRVLQLRHRLRRPGMRFAAQAILVDTADIEHALVERAVAISLRVAQHGFFGHFLQADAFDRRGRAVEIGIDEFGIQPDRIEDLRPAIGLVGRDAHLGHDLHDPLADGFDIILADLIRVEFGEPLFAQGLERFERQIGVDAFRAVTCQRAEMVHFARFAGFDDQTGLHAQPLPHQLVMHCRRREQRGHGNTVGALAAIRQDQDVGIAQYGLGRSPAHFLQRHGKPVGARACVPGDIDRGGPERAVQRDFHRTDLGQAFVGQDRLADFQALVRAGVATQQIRARADHRQQAHHQLLADRIDRRVGDLGEVLLEIIVQQAAAVRQHGDRGVGSHRTDRVLAAARHGLQEATDVFLRVPECLLAFEQAGVGARNLAQIRLDVIEILELVLCRFQPFLVRFGIGELGLELLVLDDAPFFQIDQQHASRLETPLARDVLVPERQHAAFRCEDDEIVLGRAPACGAQAVAIETGADLAAIGKAHGSRAIPWLHQGGMVFVESAARGIHQRVLRPGFRHQHHHRMGQAVSAGHQQLERIVEARGVGLPVRDQRPHLVEICAEQFAFHRPAARFHPVHVAANGVYLAIMGHESVGMRQAPAREGIRREALVDEAERRNAVRIAQVVVETAHLICQQQALVNDRAAGKAGNIGLAKAFNSMLFFQCLQRIERLLADHHQLAFEGVLIGAIRAARDHALADARHRFDHGFAQSVERCRNVAPADHTLAFLFCEAFELFGDEIKRLIRRW